MLRKYWKQLTVTAVTLACASSIIYEYYRAVQSGINTLQLSAENQQIEVNEYSKSTVLTSPQREELEHILTHFNTEVFVGKEPSFVPSSQLIEDKETLDCSKSYVYFELDEGFAKYEYYHPGKLKRRKEIGSTCWTIEYKLHFPSGMKAIFNTEGELHDFETTCAGKKGLNLQKHIVLWPGCE
ncbi:MAG: hypothetical protein Q8R37_04670 [Nanoarchaeota archaeon]|nr:hypothetical protein [Nanoarchaeota archaeon]